MERNWTVVFEVIEAYNCETKEEAIQMVKDQYGDVDILAVSC